MPSQRFFNLPDAKRKAFIDAALQEFGSYSYDSASISRLVKNLKIAKGSVYQYFENKKEIYFYLIDVIRDKRLQLLHDTIEQYSGDFFDTYLEIHRASVEFDLSNPLECLFLSKMIREWNHPELGPVHIIIRRDIIKEVEKMIKAAVKEGALRANLDTHLMAFILVNSTLNIMDYDAVKNSSLSPQSEDDKVNLSISQRESENIARQMIDIFKRGFSQ
ncbi:MAG: AcrR family transcriptional regulator [Oceanicoccus sp.]|jgi:AcrR family transcriptional regulator